MTYKGYTIAAEERIINLLDVEEAGEIGAIYCDDWEPRDFEFCVFKGEEDYTELVEIGFISVNEAKYYIDDRERNIAKFGHVCDYNAYGVCETCGSDPYRD